METSAGVDQSVADILTVADLIRRGAYLTATSSLNPLSTASRPNPHPRPPSPHTASTSAPPNPNPKPKVITPLARPSILIGAVSLPHETLRCPNKSCLQFSDESASVCCDILDFSVHVIALGDEEKKKKKICVLSWNFIPIEEGSRRSGLLEIIRWTFHDPLSRSLGLDSVPLNLSSSGSLDKLKARYRVHGRIESVSPVSVVSCSAGSKESQKMRGFLVRVLICTCGVCVCRDSLVFDMVGGGTRHSFTESSFVYFFGALWRWHPVITKLLGRVVVLAGLRKKLVFIGKDETELMLVTTDVSVLHLLRLSKRWVPILRNPIKGRGEHGAYFGTVRGVYMKGKVIELDNEVWLLLTDQQLNVPHSLRVGAVIIVWNVHYVLQKFSWTKVLVLGACFRTSILVQSFSPLQTGSLMMSISHSQLGKFISALSFSARLWAILVVSCFSRKLAGILSESEILGSKHEEGLVQNFVRSHLGPGAIFSRLGMLKEFCKHESLGCGGEPYCQNLRLVAPISTCLQYFEAIWMKTLLSSEKHRQPFCIDSGCCHLRCEYRKDHLLGRILPSKGVDVILFGRLEISKSSGRLQLVDSTGRLDVVIPDLPTSWTTDIICEVADYNLILEDQPQLGNHPGWHDHESLSYRHLFHANISANPMKLATCVHLQWKNLNCRNLCFNPRQERHDFEEFWSGRFHLIRTRHIFPVLQKYPGDQATASGPTVFVETMVLPWDLVLLGKDETALAVLADADLSHEPYSHMPYLKKQKLDKTSRLRPISDIAIHNDGVHGMSSYDSSRNTEIACGSLSYSHDVTCSVSISTDGTHSRSGRLCCTKCGGGGDAKCIPSVEMLLLEFVSDNIFMCQSVQVGNYYLVKHHPEEPFCCLKECDNVSKSRVLMTSKICFRSVSFLSDVVARDGQVSANASLDDISSNSVGISVSECVELYESSRYSDVYFHLPVNVIGYENVTIDEIIANLHLERAPFSLSNTSGAPGTSCLFPEGDLISVHGEVVAIYGLNCTPNNLWAENQFNELQTSLFQETAHALDIRVLVDNQTVTVFGSLCKRAIPVGFGPGVTAKFHRVLKSSNFSGTDRLMLTPVTCIQVHSIKIANDPDHDNFSTVQPALSQSNPVSLNFTSGMTFKPMKDLKLVEFNGRVVSLHVLVLEWNSKYNLHSRAYSAQPFVNIPLAAFILDDGSSSCCCWANDERAASLLRLHEKLQTGALGSSGCMMKRVGLDKMSLSDIVFHVERIVKKHGRITIRNCGSLVDFFQQEFIITASSEDPISSSDENLLKLIAFNACFGSLWTIFASSMKSDAVKRLEEKNLVETEMSVHTMQNLWAVNICHIDTLNQAKKIMKELQSK